MRIVPNYNSYYYIIEFSYIDEEEIIKRKDEEIMEIDVGLNNLATCITPEIIHL